MCVYSWFIHTRAVHTIRYDAMRCRAVQYSNNSTVQYSTAQHTNICVYIYIYSQLYTPTYYSTVQYSPPRPCAYSNIMIIIIIIISIIIIIIVISISSNSNSHSINSSSSSSSSSTEQNSTAQYSTVPRTVRGWHSSLVSVPPVPPAD